MTPPHSAAGDPPQSSDESQAFVLLNSIAVHVYVVDASLRVIHSDGPIEKLTGLPAAAEPAAGDSLLDLLPPRDRGRWERFARNILQNQGVDFFPGPAPHVPHARRILARPLRGLEGQAEGILFLSIELSAEGRAANAEAGERGREEDQLDLARQFAVTLNHEINNPLFVVSATLEDVLSEPLDPGLHRRLQTALDAVWKVAEAVKLLQEIRQIVSTTYIPGYTMIDLEASSHRPLTGTEPE